MNPTPRDLILVFGTVQRVMRAERGAREAGLDVDVIPAPRSVSSECGLVLEARRAESPRLSGLLGELGLEATGVWRRDSGAWLPTTLHESAAPAPVALTRHAAYGGCGAKLAKGHLATILCGLPRLQSEDLLVGIEFADDAGVIRVAEDLALIHTVDFFPPIVDDPFSFGRIAAANALSDVYAMGGRPLAGMNLISFPLSELGREVLKEILRGGIAALEEAGGLLAGGHTIEGGELLYGMAVTGTVHPDRIWRNGGARPGDALVLTKPLGTGLVTTAAKAELVDPEHLATAIRWMATLNREAARAVAECSPHAVTDVTGFALLGHAAEMAEASGTAILVDSGALPELPGARDAAAQGLVPAGTAKNRESLEGAVTVDPGVDPLRADLAFDPQTSGGLLVACSEADAEHLLRRLPGASRVGAVEAGPPGRVRLAEGRTGSGR